MMSFTVFSAAARSVTNYKPVQKTTPHKPLCPPSNVESIGWRGVDAQLPGEAAATEPTLLAGDPDG